MADDIVKRLEWASDHGLCSWDVLEDAKAEVERLRAEVERLRAAGDQLAYHVRAENAKEMYTAVRKWKEARRG